MWGRLQMRASESNKRTLVKVDEHRLRRAKMDLIPKLLEQIAAAKKANPQLVR